MFGKIFGVSVMRSLTTGGINMIGNNLYYNMGFLGKTINTRLGKWNSSFIFFASGFVSEMLGTVIYKTVYEKFMSDMSNTVDAIISPSLVGLSNIGVNYLISSKEMKFNNALESFAIGALSSASADYLEENFLEGWLSVSHDIKRKKSKKHKKRKIHIKAIEPNPTYSPKEETQELQEQEYY